MPKSWTQSVAAKILKRALLIRRVEERLMDLYRDGMIHGTIHTCVGQEMVGAVLAEHLGPEDAAFSNHRGHGHFLAFTGDTQGLIAELMGKASGVCGGRGGSQHLHKGSFYSNGVQGGIVPIAAGLAMARKLNKSKSIAVVFLGDGTLGEGALYETLNIASKQSLPILFVLENNQYAQSTHISETLAGDIGARPAAFDIEFQKADTWDYQNLFKVSGELIDKIRTAGRPGFLLVDTYRLSAHSKGDDDRSQAEIDSYAKKDPLNLALAQSEPLNASVKREIEAEIAHAIEFDPSVVPTGGKDRQSVMDIEWQIVSASRGIRMSEALNHALGQLLAANERIIFLGEDVRDPYGGAFKISKGLSSAFPDRVLNMPISEAGITGLAAGLALEGWRPVVEIMFGDFVTLAADQIINSISKFETVYGGVKLNLVIRTPMGGYRGYGPTHSQSLERLFFGNTGLKVIALNNFIDPAIIYQALLSSDSGPVICIENKVGYGRLCPLGVPNGFELLQSNENLPMTWVRPSASHVDVTILTYGGMAELAVRAADTLFEDHDLICQVICPTQISPFSIESIKRELRMGRLVVSVEEGIGFSGFGAEIAAQLLESDDMGRPDFIRVCATSSIIPASQKLEEDVLPSVQGIVDRVVHWKLGARI